MQVAVVLALNTAYTTTFDGYLFVFSGATAGDSVTVNVDAGTLFQVTPVNNLGSKVMYFVKRNTVLKITNLVGAASGAFFTPLG